MNQPEAERNRRVLVIDDMRSIHDDFRKILGAEHVEPALEIIENSLFAEEKRVAHAKFELTSAYQGREGYELAKRAREEGRPFAVAFVDVRMPPGWDGIETIEHLWKVDADLQVVICTAYSDYSWGDMLTRLGASDRMLILKKPFDNIEVLQLATALTEKWQLAQEARAALCRLEGNVASRTHDLTAMAATAKRSHELFRLLGTHVPFGVWIVDSAGRCTYSNDRWAAISGLTPDQTAGDGWTRAVHPDDLPDIVAAWATANGKPLALEFRVRRPDRSVRWVAVRAERVNAGDGESPMRLVTIEDITERKGAAEPARG